MPEHENKGRDLRSRDQQQDQKTAHAKETEPLETTILARLGLLNKAHFQPNQALPAWQKRVLSIQRFAERCNENNAEEIARKMKAEIEKDKAALQKNASEVAHIAATYAAAIRTLGKIYLIDPGAVTWGPFIDALASNTPAEVQAATIQVLISIVKVETAAQLPQSILEALWQEKLSPTSVPRLVRMTALQLLGIAGLQIRLGEQALAKILETLHDEDWQIRETAVLTLGSLRFALTYEQHVQVLDALYDENHFVRQATIIATREWEEGAIRKHLLEALQARDGTRQASAARALGQWIVPPELEIMQALRQLATNRRTASAARVASLLAQARLASTMDMDIGIVNSKERAALLKDRDEDVRNATIILDDVINAKLASSGEAETAQATGTVDSTPRRNNISDFRKGGNLRLTEEEGDNE